MIIVRNWKMQKGSLQDLYDRGPGWRFGKAMVW